MDEFSVLASQEIFESFPEWREFAREESGDDGSTFLVVEIPPLASADTVHGLWVYTCNQEITIEFDYFHSHFAFGLEMKTRLESNQPLTLSMVFSVIALPSSRGGIRRNFSVPLVPKLANPQSCQIG